MDTSKEYIKMCDCEEIQKQKPNQDFTFTEFTAGSIAINCNWWTKTNLGSTNEQG